MRQALDYKSAKIMEIMEAVAMNYTKSVRIMEAVEIQDLI